MFVFGKKGVGKSSVIHHLCGLYPPEEYEPTEEATTTATRVSFGAEMLEGSTSSSNTSSSNTSSSNGGWATLLVTVHLHVNNQ